VGLLRRSSLTRGWQMIKPALKVRNVHSLTLSIRSSFQKVFPPGVIDALVMVSIRRTGVPPDLRI
jgi:hypothetical protein